MSFPLKILLADGSVLAGTGVAVVEGLNGNRKRVVGQMCFNRYDGGAYELLMERLDAEEPEDDPLSGAVLDMLLYHQGTMHWVRLLPVIEYTESEPGSDGLELYYFWAGNPFAEDPDEPVAANDLSRIRAIASRALAGDQDRASMKASLLEIVDQCGVGARAD